MALASLVIITAFSGYPPGLGKMLRNCLLLTMKELFIGGNLTRRTQLPMLFGKRSMIIKKTHNGKIKNKKAWNPTTLEGKKPKATQDSFMYRTQNGVKSLLLDDDNCDCLSSLSMGHGMCNAGHSTSYSKSNVFGVDKLYDPGCRGPSPSYGLSLYFRAAKKLTLEDFGGGWRAFWWWEKDFTWPHFVTDILGSPYGSCEDHAAFCFQRLPSWLKERDTELLGVDSLGTVYKWSFNPKNPVAHAAWLAFRDHKEAKYKEVSNSMPWTPVALKGKVSSRSQTSFMYREQNGVRSLLIDDNFCDCDSTLNLGHGMCFTGHSKSHSKANVFGVDALYDGGCHGPVPSVGLTLYYRTQRPDLKQFGAKWRPFWWWNAGLQWSACSVGRQEKDVLENPNGSCSGGDPFCFQRLPSWLEEQSAQILARDSQNNVYRWQFNASNPTAHAAWNAFHNHKETAAGSILNQKAWNPTVLKGRSAFVDQDSFTYRSKNGVKSVLLDDDNCDCLSTIQLGATMCGDKLDPNARGIDLLYDPVCNLPSPNNGLTLYFKVPRHSLTFQGYGFEWAAFWWWPKDGKWPEGVSDVLEKPFGKCRETDIYCFGRLPSAAKEDRTRLLAIDTEENVYTWRFSSGNPTAHAAWRALHDHVETPFKKINSRTWNPTVLRGTSPRAHQDSFMYRLQAGVKSLLLDDDNCDCLSTLSMGHGMCGSGFFSRYGPANRYGVDALYDGKCNTPRSNVGLTLYFTVSDEVAKPMTSCKHGGRWMTFWWWTADATWPAKENDVLTYPYGYCSSYSEYCFGRIPSWAREDNTEMLAIDSQGNEYLWKFDSHNAVAHAAWLAFHDHVTTPAGKVLNNPDAWDPVVLKGTKPKAKQDSFMYRAQNGVKSILMDDDNCDCLTTLTIGHGMCGSGHSTSYGPANRFGVDALYDPGCKAPRPEVGLTLYFRVK